MQIEPQATAEGAISILWGKDPATPTFKGDAGVALAAKVARTYAPGQNPSDGFLVAGMAEAFSLVDALQAAGPKLTRQGLMNAVTHMHEVTNPFLAPGVTVRTTPTSRFPISAVRLQRWHRRHWVPFGGVVSAKP
jgi:hypothetical protein